MTTDSKLESLRMALQEAQTTIAEQNELLKQLTSPPFPLATIVEIHGERMTVTSGSNFTEVVIPKSKFCVVGDTVSLNPMTGQVVDVVRVPDYGKTAMVHAVLNELMTEIDFEGTTKVVFNGARLNRDLEEGDKVILDSTSTVIIQNLGKTDTAFNVETALDVTWDDIGGLEDAKQLLFEAIELPHRHPELYFYYRKRPVKGVLLYGAPGCGKTLLGKATANALRSNHAESAESGFFYIKGPEILNKYVGNSEATIRQIFQRASDFKHRAGFPAVIFIDEADAILAKRGTGKSSDMEQTIVPMFLSEMDGMNVSSAMVMLATNRIDRLDPAVIREGRIDFKVKVGRPNVKSARDIFLVHLKGLPLSSGESYETVARLGCAELFSDERCLYRIKTQSRGTLDFTLGHVISGSMVANVVDRASMLALRRDIKQEQYTGIAKSDITTAVDAVHRNNLDVDYKDDIMEFIEGFRNDVVDVEKVHSC